MGESVVGTDEGRELLHRCCQPAFDPFPKRLGVIQLANQVLIDRFVALE
jgi:hypothetical protein